MGLFNKKSDGGMLNVIRCDEPEYLIWKWRPAGQDVGDSKRENAIRWGSSLRVKDGEVAVFVYKQKDGQMQDFIEGPFDETIKTANFPVLSSIVGAAFGGGTPFQAEVYFINMAGVNQIRFGVPFFDVFDPRQMDFGVPVAVRGAFTFKITDYKAFIKLHRLVNFEMDDFKNQIKSAITKYIKGVVTNIPSNNQIPVVQLERSILQVNDIVTNYVTPKMADTFGVTVTSIDIDNIEVDKTSEGYRALREITADITSQTIKAQSAINLQNMQDMQQINAENMAETLRIQREEAQRAQEYQTKSANLSAYQLEKQAEVGIAGANALGQMGANGAMNMGSGGSMNPAAMMTGMAMGGAIGSNMAGMMNNMMGGINATPNMGMNQMNGMNGMQANMMPPPPPPASEVKFNIAVNGQTLGPYGMNELSAMAAQGQINSATKVWRAGMQGWADAGTVAELQSIFAQVPPPPPAP